MSKRRRTTLTLVFAGLLAITALAQVPGYMGRRAVAGYGFYFNPAVRAWYEGYAKGLLNTSHEGFIEYATGKKTSLGLSARLYWSAYDNTQAVSLPAPYRQLDFSPSGSYKINGRDFVFYMKAFKKGYLAPWGRYFMLGLTLNTYHAEYNPDEMTVFYEENTAFGRDIRIFSDWGPTEQSFVDFDILIGNGKSRIIADRVSIDYGYNFNVVAFTMNLINSTLAETPGTEQYIARTAQNRMRGITGFNLYVKIGYLF